MDSAIMRQCRACGETFAVRRKTNASVYCSRTCWKTALRAKRHDPSSIAERFWSKVDRDAGGGGCWIWRAAKTSSGYGKMYLRGAVQGAHRIAWELQNGAVPDGLFVLHRCDNPPCVRPDHLFLGTCGDNAADMVAKGRSAVGDRNGSRTKPERLARGDQNPARAKPERMPRGDKHYSRRTPERVARGDRHGSRTKPERVPRGEGHGCAKLTETDVREIRALYAAGEANLPQLAMRFGVDKSTVCEIIARKLWRHVV